MNTTTTETGFRPSPIPREHHLTAVHAKFYNETDHRDAHRAGGHYFGTVRGLAWVHYPKGRGDDAHRAHVTRTNFEERMWAEVERQEANRKAREEQEAKREALKTAPLTHAKVGEQCLYQGVADYNAVITKVHGSWVTVKFQLRYQRRTGEHTVRRVNPWSVKVWRRGHWVPLNECEGHDAARPQDR